MKNYDLSLTKKSCIAILLFLNLTLFCHASKPAKLINYSGPIIVIDAGHGGHDPGRCRKGDHRNPERSRSADPPDNQTAERRTDNLGQTGAAHEFAGCIGQVSLANQIGNECCPGRVEEDGE